MDKFLTFTIAGLSTAAIYAVAASGLVVTYTTSGIFNFAHGAFSMMAAFMYWQVHVAWGIPQLPAALLVVFVIGPLFGALIERVIMRGIEGTSEVVKVVVTISLMVALLGLAQVIWRPNVARPVTAFFDGETFRVFGVIVTYQRLLTMLVAVGVAIGLRLVFTRTRLGVAMRAVVDDRNLLQLNGGRPGRTSMLAWGLGACLASVSGVLIASEQTLSATTLTLLFINAYAVAVVGRLRSLPGAFLGAVILGLAQSYAIGYIPQDSMIGPISLRSLQQAIPGIMLFIVMVLQPQDRVKAHGSTRRTEARRPPSQQMALVGGAVFVVAVAAIGSLVAPSDLNLLIGGFFFAMVALSLVPLTGYAGQISLAQLTFVGIGAVAMATWGANGEPWAVLLSVLACAAVGALVAFPALRLSGIYLALATAAFALFASSMFFNQTDVMPGGNRQVPRLSMGPLSVDSDYSQLILWAVSLAVIGNLLILLRRSAWGRRLTAMKDSPVACATLGLNLTSTKVGVFALSAAIAGAAGSLSGRTFISDTLTLPSSMSITMMAVVGGVGAVSGAFFGGLILGAFPIMATMFSANAVGIFSLWSLSTRDLLAFSPGLIGISLGRNPEGAAPQLADAFLPASKSPPSLVIAAIGGAGLWLLARLEIIGNWSFLVAGLTLAFVLVPLLPLVFSPPEVPGRRAPTVAAGVVAVVVAAIVPWGTAIDSNGFRLLLILAFLIVVAQIVMAIHGAVPPRTEAVGPEPVSPDLIGIDTPLTLSDAIDADRALGIDEELLPPHPLDGRLAAPRPVPVVGS